MKPISTIPDYIIVKPYEQKLSKQTGIIIPHYTPKPVYISDGKGGKKPFDSIKHRPEVSLFEVVCLGPERQFKHDCKIGDVVIIHKTFSANRFIVEDGTMYIRVFSPNVEGVITGDPDKIKWYPKKNKHEDSLMDEDQEFREKMADRKKLDQKLVKYGRYGHIHHKS